MMDRNFSSLISAVSLTLIVALVTNGCNLAPKYKRPALEIPDEWRVPDDEASTVKNSEWWKGFNDPVLDALVLEALENNKDLKVAVARIDEYRARWRIATSQLYPQINAQATATRMRSSQTVAGSLDEEFATSGPFAALFPNGVSISPFSNDFLAVFTAAYELDLFSKIKNASFAAYFDYLGQIEAERVVILTLVTSVVTSYITLREYDDQLKISINTYNSRVESLKLAQLRFEGGLTSELEVEQAASEVDDAAIQVIQFLTLIPQQENLLSVLIGHPPQAIQRGNEIYEWPIPVEIPAGLPSDILEQRPDIVQAEAQLIAANARVGEARALLFPDISLTANYGGESSQLHEIFTNPSKTWQIAGNLLQPIFQGGRIVNSIFLADAVKKEAYYNYQQTVLTAFQEVDDALIGHQQAKKALTVAIHRVKVLEEYLHLATLQYDNGLVDYLNVLDAERRLFQSQLDLAQAQATVFFTLVNVYKALGGGWVIDSENLMKEETEDCK